jgi:hypothetical protein
LRRILNQFDQVIARAVGDEALAVLDGGVLFGNAFDSGEARGLLRDAVDQVVVAAVADRQIAGPELGELAVAAFLELRPLRGRDRPVGISDGPWQARQT